MSTRRIRFSDGIKSRFTAAQRDKLAREFARTFKRTGRRFIEKHIGDGEVMVCNVTEKLLNIMAESEW